jgi:2-polyprenyl-6-methoxyphenol hydroxylase-like FAD-dependent oxidoreductase
VTVRTDQGNTFEGSILVGADGVHSETRRQLSLASQEQDPKRSKILGNGFITRCKFTPRSFQVHGIRNTWGLFQGSGNSKHVCPGAHVAPASQDKNITVPMVVGNPWTPRPGGDQSVVLISHILLRRVC